MFLAHGTELFFLTASDCECVVVDVWEHIVIHNINRERVRERELFDIQKDLKGGGEGGGGRPKFSCLHRWWG